jgi:hypothetical protein
LPFLQAQATQTKNTYNDKLLFIQLFCWRMRGSWIFLEAFCNNGKHWKLNDKNIERKSPHISENSTIFFSLDTFSLTKREPRIVGFVGACNLSALIISDILIPLSGY